VTVESEPTSGSDLSSLSGDVSMQTSTDAAPYLRMSLIFLAISMILGAAAGLELLVPELLQGIGPLSYGRLYPVATNLFVYGWLTIGLAGALIYVVSRAGNVAVDKPRIATASLALLAVGVIAGSVGIALGFSEGRQYLEYPLWADVFIIAGMVGIVWVVGSMAHRAASDIGPVRWYAVGASLWLVLAFVVGNIPGISGVAGAFQTSFYRASFIGLWLASAGVAVVYHVIPRLAGRAAYAPTRLTVLGFWSLAFVWALTAPSNLIYSPAPDWLETVGVLFSMGLLIPPAVIFADLVLALRRRWDIAGGSIALRFVMLGGALLALWPLANLAVAFRASSGIVQFTDWVRGVEIVGFYGFASAWLIGFAYFAAPYLLRGASSPVLARIHYFGTVLGLLVWAGASFLGGLTAGYTWVATANDAAVPPAGLGFSNTLAALEGYYIAAFVGLAVFSLAQLVFVVAVFRGRGMQVDRILVDVEEPDPDPELVFNGEIRSGRLRTGAISLFVVAAVLVFVVPWAETAGVEATITADADRRYRTAGEVADGREIYLQEGCWYCHTQEVRPIVTDVGLGPVSVVGDYVYETPVLFGVQRIGPDLMHAGSRAPTDDIAWVVSYLQDPRQERSYSIMPSYDHLSASDLNALAAYIVASK
jgi:cbb3-type cytochrome oxidase subunit 1